MTQTNPPVGYEMGYGTWGTDADHTTTMYKTGDSCVLFEDTTPAVGPFLIQKVATPCAAGDLFRVSGWIRADSIASGNTVSIGLNFYDAAGDYVGTGRSYNAVLTATNTWEFKTGVVIAPSGSYGFKALMNKNNTAFHAAFDSIFVEKMPYAFETYLTGSSTIADGTIIFDNEKYDYGGIYDTTTGKFTASRDGIYGFSAFLETTDVADGEQWYGVLLAVNPSTGSSVLCEALSNVPTGGTMLVLSVAAAAVFLYAGDYVIFQFTSPGSGSHEIAIAKFYGALIA